MDQQKRLFLTIGISFALTMAFTQFVWNPKIQAEQARLDALDAGATADVLTTPSVAVPGLDAGVLPDQGTVVAAAPVAIETRRVAKDYAHTQFNFTSVGAALEDAVLQGEREREPSRYSFIEGLLTVVGKQPPKPARMDVAESSPAFPPPLSVSMPSLLDARTPYTVRDETPDGVSFAATQGNLDIVKTFKLNDSGHFHQLEVTVTNRSSAAISSNLILHLTRSITPDNEVKPSMLGDVGNEATVLCKNEDTLERKRPDNDKPSLTVEGMTHYAAIDQQYFLVSAWPMGGPTAGACALVADSTIRRADLSIPVVVAAGESVTKAYGLFLGPKDLDELKAYVPPANGFRPELEKTIDYGAFAVICNVLVYFLRAFHTLVGNWGFAIILLTVMVKVLLAPLTYRAMVAAEKMKAVQLRLKPSLDEINKKYAEDAAAKQQKTMELYQKEGINPLENLGGCLPILLQLPIWFALNSTLRTSYELYGEPFIGPIWRDLLPLLFGITQIVTIRLQPPMAADKSQAFMFQWVLPIVFTVTMMRFPAGLTLYILTNNLLTILQQFLLKRWMARTQLNLSVAK
jgi:YidC/Oxa1 family membrane protein insertase